MSESGGDFEAENGSGGRRRLNDKTAIAVDTELANEAFQRGSKSAPGTIKPKASEIFEDNRRSLPAGKAPVVSPKRSRGMSLRSQLLNRTFENNLKAAYQEEAEVYTENIEMGRVNGGSGVKFDKYSSSESPTAGNSKAGSSNSVANNAANGNTTGNATPSSTFPQKTYSINRLLESAKFALGLRHLAPSRAGRKVPLTVDQFDYTLFCRENPEFCSDFEPHDVSYQYNGAENLLVDERRGKPYVNNKIVSARYNLFNFLPKQLYAQFSKLANVYFMTIAIMQLVPNWSTTGTSTTIIPLSFFISVSIAREGIDDLRRHAQDKQENNKQVVVLGRKKSLAGSRRSTVSKVSSNSDTSATELVESSNNASSAAIEERKVRWQDVRVGQVIKLGQDSAVPADIILLSSSNENSDVFVETMDLDGETNLKTKHPHPELAKVCGDGLAGANGMITTEDPNQSLYTFEGHVIVNNKKHPLTTDNVVYRGSVIRNTTKAVGIVVFSGEESKIRMNAIKNPPTKAPHLQRYINIIVIFMICIVVGLSVGSFGAQRVIYNRVKDKYSYIEGKDAGAMPTFMSFIIMYNTLIPLSLYVTMELIKVAQLLFMQYDLDLYHKETNTPAEAKTATILEELGQVSYVFSDKTGTLTDNLMIFRNFSVGGVSWQFECLEPAKSRASQRVSRSSFERSYDDFDDFDDSRVLPTISEVEVEPVAAPTEPWSPSSRANLPDLCSSVDLIKFIQKHPHRPYAQTAKLFLLGLALCHTCFPKRTGSKVEYQASSPDELALVTAAREMGFIVFDKRQNILVLQVKPFGEAPVFEEYEVLDVVAFNSTRKRMSVVVRFPDGRVCVICKGADNVILQRLKESYKGNEASAKIALNAKERKQQEAELVISERNSGSLDLFSPSRVSMSFKREISTNQVEDMLSGRERMSEEVDRIQENSRKSLHIDQQRRFNLDELNPTPDNIQSFLESQEKLDDAFIAEKTLEHVDEFSTDGLRTLFYSYKWLSEKEYEQFSADYGQAKTALVDRQQKLDTIGEQLETGLDLLGATAIEDKLQEGVKGAIETLLDAGIKVWMLTGDKRETAINIGYSCGLIKSVSTVVVLQEDPVAQMEAAILEIKSGNVAHCVLVVDGQTLSAIEQDVTTMAMFVECSCAADAVVCCRASPAQKAALVTHVKHKYPSKVTLAIGDGANDIAMIQSADVGVGVTGKEGLQAARSADYAIAQFRFLVKLLLVHGRYNYVRTAKFVLLTFYKECMFYLSQAVFQKNTLFTGTSLYEPWSLAMFNTLFTSLPVLCVGIIEKDLRPATLIANPWLYRLGPENGALNLRLFCYHMLVAAGTCVLIVFLSWQLWGSTALMDNTIMPNGVLVFVVFTVLVNVKCQVLDLRNRNIIAFASLVIEVVGVIGWNYFITVLYKDDTSLIYYVKEGMTTEFGKDYSWWATLLFLLVIGILVDVILKVLKNWLLPSAVEFFQEFEKNLYLRSRFEQKSYPYLHQSWEFPKDRNFQKLRNVGLLKKTTIVDGSSVVNVVEVPNTPATPTTPEISEASDKYSVYILPSGKIHKRRKNDTRLTKIGKKIGFIVDDNSLKNQLDIIEE